MCERVIKTERSHQGWRAVVEVNNGSFVTNWLDTEERALQVATRWLNAWVNSYDYWKDRWEL